MRNIVFAPGEQGAILSSTVLNGHHSSTNFPACRPQQDISIRHGMGHFYLALAVALRHLNIRPVYEIAEMGGETFVSMAFIEGQRLDKKIQWRPELTLFRERWPGSFWPFGRSPLR